MTFDERIEILETAVVKIANDAENFPSLDEINIVVREIFDTIQDLKNRISEVERVVKISSAIATSLTE